MYNHKISDNDKLVIVLKFLGVILGTTAKPSEPESEDDGSSRGLQNITWVGENGLELSSIIHEAANQTESNNNSEI